DYLRERAHDRRGGASAIRRSEADRQRPPRGRLGGVRLLLRDESRVRGLFREAAARADRHRSLSVARATHPIAPIGNKPVMLITSADVTLGVSGSRIVGDHPLSRWLAAR